MSGKNNTILMVGNFFHSENKSHQYCQSLMDEFQKNNMAVISTSSVNSRVFRTLDMLSDIFFKRKKYSLAIVDVFSEFSFYWAFLSLLLLKVYNKKTVLVLHGGRLPEWAKNNEVLLRMAFNVADCLVAPSIYLAQELNGYCPDNKIIQIIPNAINLTSFKFDKQRTSQDIKICWLRAFSEVYNPQMAIKAMSLVLECHPDVSLYMYGPVKDHTCFDTCEKMIKDRGLQKKIVLKKAVDKANVPKVLAEYDIFLNTSIIDNMPISILEALAVGLPVISTNVGGLECLLTHKKNALLVEPNDYKAMSEWITCVINDTTLFNRLKNDGSQMVKQFDWSTIYPQWEQLLTRISSQP